MLNFIVLKCSGIIVDGIVILKVKVLHGPLSWPEDLNDFMKCLTVGIYTEICPQGSPPGEGARRADEGQADEGSNYPNAFIPVICLPKTKVCTLSVPS
jgi:hypothetical protein